MSTTENTPQTQKPEYQPTWPKPVHADTQIPVQFREAYYNAQQDITPFGTYGPLI